MQKNYLLNREYKNAKNFFESGKGSYIYIKKKKFIDLNYCAGSLLLGHNSKILKNSFKLLLKNNISNFASTNIHAVNLSKIIKKILPHYSNIIFCNSGTEAVFKGLRICRAITNNKKIISVVGSWHGSADSTLYSADKNLRPKKISDGLSEHSKKNIIFIPYNDIVLSRKILNNYKKEIQCIIIEPIQAGLPLENAKKYLKFLEKFSKVNNTILFFDEMITGLRTDGKSVQSFYNIKPDISVFGKCFGGGMPIGFIALNKKIVAKIKKKNLNIFFGGTFSGNSINMYIANQNLKYIIKNKKKIFRRINNFAKLFQKNINTYCISNSIDARIIKFKSMARLIFSKKKINNRIQRDFCEKNKSEFILKFKKYLFTKRINYPDIGNIFFAYSLSKKDLKYLIKIFKLGLKKFF